jgi:hypothetical protein
LDMSMSAGECDVRRAACGERGIAQGVVVGIPHLTDLRTHTAVVTGGGARLGGA